MIGIYCRHNHQTRKSELCRQCRGLLEYALLRLEKCPFQEGKTTCGNCKIHCYKPGMRQKIREAMRFAGPRMVWRHPLMAIEHMIDGRRKEPVRKNGVKS